FEALPDIEPSPPESIPRLEIQSTSLAGLEPSPSGVEIEPAFDLSINDIDISPLEGLESAADPTQFAIDPELAGGNASGVEGLISETNEPAGEPGLGEPLFPEVPPAGLIILVDERLFVHEPA